jgi:hypothetical protein
MSALGHKRTFRSAIAMSALPPKADIQRHLFEVRIVAKADSCTATRWCKQKDGLVAVSPKSDQVF